MTRPLILVVGRWTDQIRSSQGVYIPRKLLDAVARAGGEPVLVWPETDERAERLVGLADGVILPGGVDLDLRPYGIPDVHPRETHAPKEQDAADVTIARATLAAELPLLAICRGMQVLNVVMGGSIHQHFEETTVVHHDNRHPFEITAGSQLAKIIGDTQASGYSNHHQACDQLADGLMQTAASADGIIEGFESPDRTIVGVQWHPEIDAADDPIQQAPFDWLVGESGSP